MSRPNDREQRVLPLAGLEMRVAGTESEPTIEGYAAVFNQPSEVLSDWLGSFREYVAPGAFTKTLKDGADVRALLNHDPNFVLGRTKAGTLTLREDAKGLWYSVTPPDTQWARDLVAVMRRGDIDQSSFAFRTVKDRWGVGKTDDGNEIDERWLLEAQLFDVSPVTYPAYPQTSSDVRSLLAGAGIDDPTIRTIERARRGLPLTGDDHARVRAVIERLSTWLPAAAPIAPDHAPAAPIEPVASDHSPVVDLTPIDPHRAARLRARLVAVERLAKGA